MRIFITGIGGLIGSTMAEVARDQNHQVWGVDNDKRGEWFGREGSVDWRLEEIEKKGVTTCWADFRDRLDLVRGADLIVHCASQPSHDFSRTHVLEDSRTNYMGTVELLEAYRGKAPKAIFAFMSTNKVYGDRVNTWMYEKKSKRFILDPDNWHSEGVEEGLTIDDSLHTPFGVSKTAADLMVQEYRKCFGLTTVSFRCGCLTGKAGSAIELQGFLGYLVKCAVRGERYTIYGHDGYQVRDNIDAADVANAILHYAGKPKGAVYNMGGGPGNSVSILECIDYLRTKHALEFEVRKGPERIGDHKWWITDTTKFEQDYPTWTRKSVWDVIDEMVAHEVDRQNRKN